MNFESVKSMRYNILYCLRQNVMCQKAQSKGDVLIGAVFLT